MESITIKGLTFVPYLTRDRIAEQVERVAGEICRDYSAGDAPIFICVLSGAFVFAADLFRQCAIPTSEITFMRFKSYEGTGSTGTVNQVLGLKEDISGRHVIIVEDIVDTGVTAREMVSELEKLNPASVRFATLLYKPESNRTGFVPDYYGFSIPPKFIVGYGLDLDGMARGLRDIYVVSERPASPSPDTLT